MHNCSFYVSPAVLHTMEHWFCCNLIVLQRFSLQFGLGLLTGKRSKKNEFSGNTGVACTFYSADAVVHFFLCWTADMSIVCYPVQMNQLCFCTFVLKVYLSIRYNLPSVFECFEWIRMDHWASKFVNVCVRVQSSPYITTFALISPTSFFMKRGEKLRPCCTCSYDHLQWLQVHPSLQRRGIGRKIVDKITRYLLVFTKKSCFVYDDTGIMCKLAAQGNPCFMLLLQLLLINDYIRFGGPI
jgi:hypothetical protein